jgi:hypothetical protein
VTLGWTRDGFCSADYFPWERPFPLCHLDRSAAQWRDFCVDAPSWECFSFPFEITPICSTFASTIDNAGISVQISRTLPDRGFEVREIWGDVMKRLAICAGCLLASLSIFAQSPQTYKGEIIDSQCAALGGHQVMAKQGESEKDCTNRCVSMGGRYTLYDPATKTAYQLDDAKKAATFAGAKVTVTGTLNSTTKTIKVASIKAGA